MVFSSCCSVKAFTKAPLVITFLPEEAFMAAAFIAFIGAMVVMKEEVNQERKIRSEESSVSQAAKRTEHMEGEREKERERERDYQERWSKKSRN